MLRSSPKVRLSARQAEPGIGIIDVRGELTGQADEQLMQAYNRATEDSAGTVILNFTGLEYMNSSGIGLLVTLLIRAQRQGQRLLAYGLSDHYRQIFELTRLNEVIGLYRSEAEALSAVPA